MWCCTEMRFRQASKRFGAVCGVSDRSANVSEQGLQHVPHHCQPMTSVKAPKCNLWRTMEAYTNNTRLLSAAVGSPPQDRAPVLRRRGAHATSHDASRAPPLARCITRAASRALPYPLCLTCCPVLAPHAARLALPHCSVVAAPVSVKSPPTSAPRRRPVSSRRQPGSSRRQRAPAPSCPPPWDARTPSPKAPRQQGPELQHERYPFTCAAQPQRRRERQMRRSASPYFR